MKYIWYYLLVILRYAKNTVISGSSEFYYYNKITNECLHDFDFLVHKIETDYPGYHDKVTENTKKELQQLEQSIRMKIQNHPDSCGKYLSAYSGWFKDNHLCIRRVWSSAPADNTKQSVT